MMELPMSERSCGNCDVCCNILEVRELNKKSYKNCDYRAEGGGCGIYNDRPSICRTWNCAYILGLMPNQEALRPNNLGLMFYPVSAKNNDLGIDMLMGQEVWLDAIYSSDCQKVIDWLKPKMMTMIRHYNSEKFTYFGPQDKVKEFEEKHAEYMAKQLSQDS
jgi:hypothetical protein